MAKKDEDDKVAYKFRRLSEFDYIEDIFCNHRFYAATFEEFRKVNDLLEGVSKYDKDVLQDFRDEVESSKSEIRICSFSQDSEHLWLWKHYADEFKGICIELELEALSTKIAYTDSDILPCISNKLIEIWGSSLGISFENKSERSHLADCFAREFLGIKNRVSRKGKLWQCEKEVRVFTDQEYIILAFRCAL
jgi:Protein of unknown function (DUF2971)